MWRDTYTLESLPPFPCPRCSLGTLSLVDGSFKVKDAFYSVRNQREDWWDPDRAVTRFVLFLGCTNLECGEVVSVAGDCFAEPKFDEQSGMTTNDWETWLKPKAFNPAPLLLRLPASVPEKVAAKVRLASWHYWADMGASVGALRSALELILDELGIPRARESNGKRMNLGSRVDALAEKGGNHKKVFTALRMVGNLGAHGESVESKDLLDAFEIMEHVLVGLFAEKKKTIDELAAELIDRVEKRGSK